MALLVALLLPVLAWGPYHADVQLNAGLDPAARTRWRIALYLLPGSMAVYWLAHVRPRRDGG